MDLLLYAVVVFIWGSTWLAIKLQLGVVPPETSVAYRFALAAVLMLAWCLYRRLPMRFNLRDHAFMALVGIFMFSTNFVLFYFSEENLTSGLVALIFSMALLVNMLNGRIFLGRSAHRSVLLGAAFGLTGIVLVFLPELLHFSLGTASARGILLALGGTLLFSFGNVVSARNQSSGLPVIQSTAISMAYGALLLAPFALVLGHGLSFDPRLPYVGALLYLAIFGSIVGFSCYLTLLGRIGVDRAAYATVLFPIIALTISSLVEGLTWTPRTFYGIALILIGNSIVLTKPELLRQSLSRIRAGFGANR